MFKTGLKAISWLKGSLKFKNQIILLSMRKFMVLCLSSYLKASELQFYLLWNVKQNFNFEELSYLLDYNQEFSSDWINFVVNKTLI